MSNTTKISSIVSLNTNIKNLGNPIINGEEYISNVIDYSLRKKYLCWYCKGQCDIVIGCPVEENYQKISIGRKTNQSICYITQQILNMDEYENIEKDKSVNLDQSYRMIKMEGAFCSYECCLSYIKDNKNSDKNCEQILRKMYFKYCSKDHELKPAPSWKTLKDFGGSLTLDEFRASFTRSSIIPVKISNIKYKDDSIKQLIKSSVYIFQVRPRL